MRFGRRRELRNISPDSEHSQGSQDPVLLVGIDEAGYGPVLGPLVVSAIGWRVPAALADVPLGELLRGAVTDDPRGGGATSGRRGASRGGDRRVAVTDSKKLYNRADGLAKLERSALCGVAAWRACPANLSELLTWIAPQAVEALAEYPWYGAADAALPLEAGAGGVRVAAAGLRREAAARGVEFAGVWCEVLPEGHFNRRVAHTGNKSTVLLDLTLRLMQRVTEAHVGDAHPIRFVIDKQGGRGHYRVPLMRAFEDRAMRVLEEGADSSRYRLECGRGGAAWDVGFLVRGESRQLPIAWASLVSKYVRELLMHAFNGYWRGVAPQVAPTAGYYTDGLRFLREMDDHIRRLGVAREMLVRSR